MSTNVRVYRIMIASPSDVIEERTIIKEAMEYWNYRYGLEYQIMFIPLLWEYDSYPAIGRNPQTLLDKQLCDNSDMLVAIFWSKLGTPTNSFPSGTVEEIHEHVDKEKPVFLYFNKAPLPQEHDFAQFDKLREFKKEIRDKALYYEYADKNNLKNAFIEHLRSAVKNNPYFAEKEQVEDSVTNEDNEHNGEDTKPALHSFGVLFNGIENEIDLTVNNNAIPNFIKVRMKQFSDDAKLILSNSIPKNLLPYIDKIDLERFKSSIKDQDTLMEYLSKWRRFLFLSQQEPVEIECRVWNRMEIFAEEIHVFIDKPQKIYFAESLEEAKKVADEGYDTIPNPLDVARKKMEEVQKRKNSPLEQYKNFVNSINPVSSTVSIMPSGLPHLRIHDPDFNISVEDGRVSMYLKQLSQSLHRGFPQKLYAIPLEIGQEEIKVTYICKQIRGKAKDTIFINVR